MSVVKINAITVPRERFDDFAQRFASRAGKVSSAEGFEAFELLRPNDDREVCLVVTRWRSEEDFKAWLSGPDFKAGHAQHRTGGPVGTSSELWSFDGARARGPVRIGLVSGRAVAVLAALAVAAAAGGAVVVASAPESGETAADAAPPEFRILGARVSPRRAYFAGRRVQMTFRVAAPAPVALQIEVVRNKTDQPVATLVPPPAQPGTAQLVEWDGLTDRGEVAPNGGYRMRIRGADGRVRRGGTFRLRSHTYPIRGRHADRGPIGTFGVGRSGGRTHQGFDVNAACGTPVVAARGGRVARAGYDPVLYGNFVIVRGEKTRRDYWYSHLKNATRLRVGDRVRTGQRIGSIGDTGNARTIGCHLHFEIHSRGRPIDPAPELHAWDRWS